MSLGLSCGKAVRTGTVSDTVSSSRLELEGSDVSITVTGVIVDSHITVLALGSFGTVFVRFLCKVVHGYGACQGPQICPGFSKLKEGRFHGRTSGRERWVPVNILQHSSNTLKSVVVSSNISTYIVKIQ